MVQKRYFVLSMIPNCLVLPLVFTLFSLYISRFLQGRYTGISPGGGAETPLDSENDRFH